MRRFAVLWLVTAVAASGACATASAADGFLAGAGRIDTTPPLANTPAATAVDATFAKEFATLCPAAAYPAHGIFSLQEPFNDLNGNGIWDSGETMDTLPEPYCDANNNGHWDGIYTSGKGGQATGVHDPIEARAVAIAQPGAKPVVYASVAQQGIFENYTDAMRDQLKNNYGVDADLVVSANHNESSPDSVGIYGAFNTPAGASARSGIDEYFMRFLEDHVAHAAADAVHRLAPASLYARQVPMPSTLDLRYSRQFPTAVATDADPDTLAATDTKLGVLQARGAGGAPIFTVMSFAAHNQEMGNAGKAFSGDWPGYFATAYDNAHPGIAMFLVGDNGSQEDPQSSPPVVPNGSENHTNQDVQGQQAKATGEAFAAATEAAAAKAVPLGAGPVRLRRTAFCVPLENNGFAALAAAGVFGQRSAYACTPDGTPVAPTSQGKYFRTYVAVADIGPDLQLVDNPGEAFPALMVGSPWGKEEASCDRPNPPVPTWHARAPFRFQVGLADDLIGYEIPAWGFYEPTPGLFPPDCTNGGDEHDPRGHKHKLESEGVGPTAGNNVAERLTTLLDQAKDPSAHIGNGRYVRADGSLSRWPTGAVGVLLADPGATSVSASSGRLIAVSGVAGFGGRAVDATGTFMDFDGQPQSGPDINTRGMVAFDPAGCATERDYVSVFDPLTGSGPGATRGAPDNGAPAQRCTRADGTQAHTAGSTLLGTGSDDGKNGSGSGSSGSGAGAGGSSGAGATGARCVDRFRPGAKAAHRRVQTRKGVLRTHGTASDRGCGGRPGSVARVTVTIIRAVGRRCRYVGTNGRLTRSRSCRRPISLLAHGKRHWSLRKRLHVPRGRYTAIVRAVDRAGNVEAARRGPNVVRATVR